VKKSPILSEQKFAALTVRLWRLHQRWAVQYKRRQKATPNSKRWLAASEACDSIRTKIYTVALSLDAPILVENGYLRFAGIC
jgi:hypothetical protein